MNAYTYVHVSERYEAAEAYADYLTEHAYPVDTYSPL